MTYKIISERIPNGKGLNLSTELYIPGSETEPHPTVLLFHGFTGYKESPDLVDLSKKLAEKGICAVRFTASGFGDSDGTIDQNYRFSNHRNDAERIYDYVSHEPYVAVEKIGIYGNSLGGKLAVLFAAAHPEIRALCITSAPVSMYQTMYKDLLPEWEKTGYFEKISGRTNTPVRIPYAFIVDEELPTHDVLAAAKRLTPMKALVIAGEEDTEVPKEETERIFEAMACRAEFRVIPGMVHKYKSQPDIMERVNQSITAFFEAGLL